jgi:hypothetical protein
VQIVDQIAAAHNQDTVITQWSELSTDLKVEGSRLSFVNAELNHRNIGIWIYMPQHRPGPVIESP